jgi:t-SNARE complex subunit (syntaxin)
LSADFGERKKEESRTDTPRVFVVAVVGAQQNRREKKSARKARKEAVRVAIIIIVAQVLQTSLGFGALMFVCLVVFCV